MQCFESDEVHDGSWSVASHHRRVKVGAAVSWRASKDLAV
jgi:hypothetical protein